MKVVFISILVGIGVLAAVLSFIALQFDPNALRPQFEDYLGEYLQSEVELASLSVRWGITPRFEVSGLRIVEPESKEPVLQAGRVWASARLLPLFKKQLWIKSLLLESPHIVFLRRQDKSWNWNTTVFGVPSWEEPAAADKTPQANARWTIQLGPIQAADATVDYRDHSLQPPFSIQLKNLNFVTSQPKKSEPFAVQFEMPASRTLRATGSLRVDPAVQNLWFQMDAGESLSTEIRVQSLFAGPHFRLKSHFQDFPLQDVAAGALDLTGHLSGDFEGAGQGMHPQEWAASLSLEGNFRLTRGEFRRVNMVRRAFTHLAVIPIPRLARLSQLDFPLDFYEIVQGSGTPFHTCTGTLRSSDNKIFVEDLLLEHPDYTVQFNGSFHGPDRYAQLRGAIAFSQSVSEILISEVPVMDALRNPQNEVLLPLEYRGTFPQSDIFVDLDFVANRFVEVRGEELASLGIQNLNEFLEAHRQ